MADHEPLTPEAIQSQSTITQIREMLSRAVRIRRTDSAGDLMPNVSSNQKLLHVIAVIIWNTKITVQKGSGYISSKCCGLA